MRRDTEMLRAAAMVGLLSNPQSRARYDHSSVSHATRDPKHTHAGKDHPTFAEWIASEATMHAEAFESDEALSSDPAPVAPEEQGEG